MGKKALETRGRIKKEFCKTAEENVKNVDSIKWH